MSTSLNDPTYIDIMATALALAGPGPLTSSDNAWNAAFRAALVDPEAAALLPNVTFELREPYPALSDEIEALRRVLIRAEALWLTGGPRQPLMVWPSEKTRASLLDHNAELLAAHRPTLERMAVILADHLRRAAP